MVGVDGGGKDGVEAWSWCTVYEAPKLVGRLLTAGSGGRILNTRMASSHD